jgi:hypothetical protein
MDENEPDLPSPPTQESERRWDELFGRSPNLLEQLAAKAMAEHDAGRTQPLDPDSLCGKQ